MKKILKNVPFVTIFAITSLLILNSVYKQIGYGYFKKALTKEGVTFFTRDSKVRYSEMNSYKIENKDYNNSTFYKRIKVKRNTPYRITCMIKTENVSVLDNLNQNSGAQIILLDSDEHSMCLTGTNDWTKVSLEFNSKQNDEIKVGFMLGAKTDYGNVNGTAWFSDLLLEEGTELDDTNWKFACFIIKNVNVTLGDINYKYHMTDEDINKLKDCMSRFKSTCEELSDNKMSVTYDCIEIESAIKSLSYDEKRGYYISPKDAEDIIKTYIEQNEYDHIFVCSRLNDENSKIQCKNWIGLGGMEYTGEIGFSNVRMPTSMSSTKYTYNKVSNRFPEEVFVHEFLHSLEKNSEKYGFNVPALHDYEKYGYNKCNEDGLYEWFKAYMTETIGNSNEGLNGEIYKMKPLKQQNFENVNTLNEFNDVTNIFERLQLVCKSINKYFMKGK